MIKAKHYHSKPHRSEWKLILTAKVISYHATQAKAYMAALRAGRAAARDGGIASAVLHDADGSVRRKRTFGGFMAPGKPSGAGNFER
jgi:hypothetical protein